MCARRQAFFVFTNKLRKIKNNVITLKKLCTTQALTRPYGTQKNMRRQSENQNIRLYLY